MTIEKNGIYACLDIGSSEHHAYVATHDQRTLKRCKISHKFEDIAAFIEQLQQLSEQEQLPVKVVIEGYNGYANPLDQMCIEAGIDVLSANSTQVASYRKVARVPTKSDKHDAELIYRFVRANYIFENRDNALNTIIAPSNELTELRYRTRRRADLVKDRTALQLRLKKTLLAVAPEFVDLVGNTTLKTVQRLIADCNCFSDLKKKKRAAVMKIKGAGAVLWDKLSKWQKKGKLANNIALVGPDIVEDMKRILSLSDSIARLDANIKSLSSHVCEVELIEEIPGVGPVSASTIVGEILTIKRFRKSSSLAHYSGVACIPNESGKYTGTRNPVAVNKRLKRALMDVALQHIRYSEEGRIYYEKQVAKGKKPAQALRCVARQLIKVIYAMLRRRAHYLRETVETET